MTITTPIAATPPVVPIAPGAAGSSIDPSVDPAGGEDRNTFLREMVRRLDGDPDRADTPEDLAAIAAQRLLSATFVEPIVREARENHSASGLFAPGVAEQRFGHLMDRRTADAVVGQDGFAGVQQLERQLLDSIRQSLGTPSVEGAPS